MKKQISTIKQLQSLAKELIEIKDLSNRNTRTLQDMLLIYREQVWVSPFRNLY